MDLLLYFINRDRIDIYNIPIFKITKDYFEYINMMETMDIDLGAEFIYMSTILIQIKARMLLPKAIDENSEQLEDPRAELIHRLQEYQRFKQISEKLDAIPRLNRDFFSSSAKLPEFQIETPVVEISLQDLSQSLSEVMQRMEQSKAHLINFEQLSRRERMSEILYRFEFLSDTI